MSQLCTTPRHADDTRYLYGRDCTWHGRINGAEHCTRLVDASPTGDGTVPFEASIPCCPYCGGLMYEMPNEDEFWRHIRDQEQDLPGYEAILRYGGKRCYPDFDTLQSAYRQAMEGQQ